MDVSDGFVGDLAKMLRASGATAEVDLDRLPLSEAAREAVELEPGLFTVAATGGDDYELLLSVSPERAAAFEAAAAAAGVAVADIGVAGAGGAPPRFRRGGREIVFASGSYSHF